MITINTFFSKHMEELDEFTNSFLEDNDVPLESVRIQTQLVTKTVRGHDDSEYVREVIIERKVKTPVIGNFSDDFDENSNPANNPYGFKENQVLKFEGDLIKITALKKNRFLYIKNNSDGEEIDEYYSKKMHLILSKENPEIEYLYGIVFNDPFFTYNNLGNILMPIRMENNNTRMVFKISSINEELYYSMDLNSNLFKAFLEENQDKLEIY